MTRDSDDRDRLLVAAHLAGEPGAFEALVRRHQDRLWSLALRTTGNREDAADALQDALLSAYRSLGGFRGDARVTTWLHRVVVNACLDRIRRNAARATLPLPDTELACPRDPLGQRETGLDVEAALRSIPAEQRLALVLVDVQGLSVDEAAVILDIPVGTVKSRCFRGRARLARQLGHLRSDVPSPSRPPGGALRMEGGPP